MSKNHHKNLHKGIIVEIPRQIWDIKRISMAIRMNESESLSRYNDHVDPLIEWYWMSRPTTTTSQRNFRVGVYDECLPLRYTHLWVLYGFIFCSPVDLHPREGTL